MNVLSYSSCACISKFFAYFVVQCVFIFSAASLLVDEQVVNDLELFYAVLEPS